MSYRFFFSYSRETYEASSAVDGVNHLDQFYEDLTKQLSLLTGDKINAGAARDTDRLRISDNWGDELINLLQESSVLVCIITPHYLKSIPCGREVELFRQRHAQLDGKLGGDRQRILLVFWIAKSEDESFILLGVFFGLYFKLIIQFKVWDTICFTINNQSF